MRILITTVLLLAACGDTGPRADRLAAADAPPPPYTGFRMHVGNVTKGEVTEVRLFGAPPGAEAYLLASTSSGASGTCVTPIPTGCSSLDTPIALLARGPVDASGNATLTFRTPRGLPLSEVYLQGAVTQAAVGITDVVWRPVEDTPPLPLLTCPATLPPLAFAQWAGAEVIADTLYVDASYSGGCAVHTFGACWDGTFAAGTPLSVDITLGHHDPGDPCDAFPTESLRFDLTDVRHAHEATIAPEGPVEIQTDGGTPLYEF